MSSQDKLASMFLPGAPPFFDGGVILDDLETNNDDDFVRRYGIGMNPGILSGMNLLRPMDAGDVVGRKLG
jgi:hypothetical protein